MDAGFRESLTIAAVELSQTPKPNSDSHESLYEKCVHIGNRAHSVLADFDSNPFPALESLIVEIGEIEYNLADLDREHLTIAFMITNFQNLLFSYVNSEIRSTELASQSSDDIRNELNELADIVKKLDSYIQEGQKIAKLDSRIEKAAGMAQINLFFFSIPMQSVFDLVKAARKELEKPGNVSVRFVSSLLTNASFIANEFWEKIKSNVRDIPFKYQEFTKTVRVQTSLAASKAVNYVYKAKLRKIKPRSQQYSSETESFALANRRELLIKFLIDFRNWSPKNVEAIFNSSLFTMIMLDKSFYPHTQKAVSEISQDIVFLQNEKVDSVQKYVCKKAEEVIEILSHEINKIETESNYENKKEK